MKTKVVFKTSTIFHGDATIYCGENAFAELLLMSLW